MGKCSKISTTGLTLIELIVVLAVLVAMAGIAIPLLNGTADDSADKVTRSTLIVVRNAIQGTTNQLGYATEVGALPEKIKDLFHRRDLSSSPVFPVVPTYDINSKRGWNGPYLQGATATYSIDNTRNFTSVYGDNGDPALLDGWGHSIVIQRPTTSDTDADKTLFTRLVSAGPDGIISTPSNVLYPTPAQRGDDIIFFLKRSDVTP